MVTALEDAFIVVIDMVVREECLGRDSYTLAEVM